MMKNPARDGVLTSVFLLAALGVVMVFSASAFHWTVRGDSFYFLRRQLAWLPIGILAALFFYQVDYRALARYYLLPLAAAVVLLAVVLVPQLGRDVNAARRWLPLGGGMQFQPSELAKLAVIVFVAGFLAGDPERARRFWRGFMPASFTVFVVFGLVLVEPDFGTALFLLAVALALLLLGGMRLHYLVLSAALFAPAIAVFAAWRWEKIETRLLGFLEPEKIYQVKHSLLALGSGGWLGQGLGAGSQKLQFLPEAHTDFIFSILGEELGLAGTLFVIALFLVLLASGVRIAWRAGDLFGFLLAAGITISLTLQAALNIAVVTASVPTKGIPLPFLTFGGSGLFITLVEVGLLLSIERVERQSLAPAPAGLDAAGPAPEAVPAPAGGGP